MRSRCLMTIVALVAVLALGVVATASASAFVPVWHTREAGITKGEGNKLAKGESREVTIEGESIEFAVERAAQAVVVNCTKASGTGTVVGGSPGTGHVTSLTFSGCTSPSERVGKCKISVLPKIENFGQELVVLNDSKTIALQWNKIDTETNNSNKEFFAMTECGEISGPINLRGSDNGSLPKEEFNLHTPMSFPKLLENEHGHLESGSGGFAYMIAKYKMTLKNGEKLAAYTF
jgi:hypothetical protein